MNPLFCLFSSVRFHSVQKLLEVVVEWWWRWSGGSG